MTDQLTFNNSLSLLGVLGTGLTTMTGTANIDYGTTNTVTGSLNLTAAGLLSAQTYTNLAVTQTGTDIGGTPIYTLTGSNTLTSLSVTYTGQLPATAAANITLLSTGLSVASGSGNVASIEALCFAYGTKILTERGEVVIEELRIGDWVVTPYAETPTMQIRWIGRQCFKAGAARSKQPILLREGALGAGFPHRDLRLSGDHCLYLDGSLVPAKLLANGVTIVAEEGNALVEYANIELDKHTVILAEGVATETYLDCGNRCQFDNVLEPSAWLASRLQRDDSAWNNGSAFAPPLWSGMKLELIIGRLACIDIASKEFAFAA